MLITIVTDILESYKAQDTQILSVEKLTPFMDNLIICTATSGRHAKSIAAEVIKSAKKDNYFYSVEGLSLGEWILVDLGSIIVHIMQHDQRHLYQLEKLWSYPVIN